MRTNEPEIWGQFGYYAAKKGRPRYLRDALKELSVPEHRPAPPDIAGLRALGAIWLESPASFGNSIQVLEDHVAAQPVGARQAEAREIRWAAMILALQLRSPRHVGHARVLHRTAKFLLDTGEQEFAEQSFVRAAPRLAGAERAESLAYE